ncbi:MAG: twitching motility protein PilT, partial [Ignavibacteriales bacterium]|nr:twitching motility protein PilT [Ignavibacteriales bacterium]
SKAIFRFYEELNDFLPRERRKTDFEVDLKGKGSIKEMIEAIGVPHREIDLILVNGRSVDFNYILQDRDQISVYPVFESLNIEDIIRIRNAPLRRTRFIADVNIGEIVKYMRLLGFDVYFNPSLSIKEMIEISKRGKRIILTKSKNLLKFKDVTHGIFVRSDIVEVEIKGIMDLLDIKDNIRPFSRCLCCNSHLKTITKEEIEDRIPAKIKESYNEYYHCKILCKSCDNIYCRFSDNKITQG